MHHGCLMNSNSPDTFAISSPDTGAFGGENARFGCSSFLTKAFKGVTEAPRAFALGLETTRRGAGFLLAATLLRSCCESGAEWEGGNLVTAVVDPVITDETDGELLLRFC